MSSALRFPTSLFHTVSFFHLPRFEENRVAPLTRIFRRVFRGGELGEEGGRRGVLVLVGCSGGLMAWQ